MRLLRGGLAALLACLSLFAAARPALALTPSPVWKDQVIYQVVTDRFFNGNPANDAVEGSYNPADGARTHGGDFAGLRQKLDYLQMLGVTALWISPVVINTGGEYHGYAAKDLYTIAPHMGTKAELQALVADCHARGMYVVIDVVCNHMGTLLTSTASGYPGYNYPTGYPLSWRDTNNKYPGSSRTRPSSTTTATSRTGRAPSRCWARSSGSTTSRPRTRACRPSL